MVLYALIFYRFALSKWLVFFFISVKNIAFSDESSWVYSIQDKMNVCAIVNIRNDWIITTFNKTTAIYPILRYEPLENVARNEKLHLHHAHCTPIDGLVESDEKENLIPNGFCKIGNVTDVCVCVRTHRMALQFSTITAF